jgi:hypothetical protein
MTAKELAGLFAAAKVPVPEMEQMINELIEDELEKFWMWHCEIVTLHQADYKLIDSYLKSKEK